VGREKEGAGEKMGEGALLSWGGLGSGVGGTLSGLVRNLARVGGEAVDGRGALGGIFVNGVGKKEDEAIRKTIDIIYRVIFSAI
jgi:hypothetical protein